LVCGYDSSKKFDSSQCLYRNFKNMCGLSIFKNNSPETRKLIELLEKHNDVLKPKCRRNVEDKIEALDAIIDRIRFWKEARANVAYETLSSRAEQVHRFSRAIQTERNKL